MGLEGMLGKERVLARAGMAEGALDKGVWGSFSWDGWEEAAPMELRKRRVSSLGECEYGGGKDSERSWTNNDARLDTPSGTLPAAGEVDVATAGGRKDAKVTCLDIVS
jgi:hypothetical protein